MTHAAIETGSALSSMSSVGAERLQSDHDHAVAALTAITETLCASLECQAEAAAVELEAKGGQAAEALTEQAHSVAGELGGAGAQAAGAAKQAQGKLEQAAGQAGTQLTAATVIAALRKAATAGNAELTATGTAAAAHFQQVAATVSDHATQAGAGGAQMLAHAGQTAGQQLEEASAQSTAALGQASSQFAGAMATGAQQAQGAISRGVDQAVADQQTNLGQVQAKKQSAIQEVGSSYDALKSQAESQSEAEQGSGQKSVWGWITGTWSKVTAALKRGFASVFGNWLGGFLYGLISSALMLLVVIGILALIAAIFTPFVAAVCGIALLVVGVGLGIYGRFQMFKAYNDRFPGWGEGTLLVLLGISDITGIPKIIEGLAGRRAFSNGNTMNGFDSGESVGSGIVDLIGLLLLIRGIKGGLKAGEPADPTVDPTKSADPTGRVNEPKPGVWDDAKPGVDISGWKFTDAIRMDGDFKVVRTEIEVGGKRGWIERAYNPTTKELQMRNAFLEDLPKWINEGTPMVDGKGTPTVTWLTLRQMKLLGMEFGGAYKVKMSTIQNLKAIIQFQVLRARGMAPNEAVLQTHSVQYAETSIVQAGNRVVKAEVGGDVWKNPLDFLMKHYERTPPDPAIVAKHDKLIADFGEGVVDRNTVVWMNYDVTLTVEPFGAGGTSGPGAPVMGKPGTGPSSPDDDNSGQNN